MVRDLLGEQRKPVLHWSEGWLYQQPDLAAYAKQGAAGYEHWESGELLALRGAETASSGRVKAWRKRHRDGTLPPILLWWVVPLDMFVLLDGHERLLASLEEGSRPPCLMLYGLHFEDVPANMDMQKAVERLAKMFPEGSRGSRKLSVERLNELATEAWGERPYCQARTRGIVIPGGVRAWEAEVRRRLEGLGPGGCPTEVREGLLEP